VPAHTVTETESNTGQVTASLVVAGHSVSGPVASTRAVAAVAVASPIPLTGVSELGPTLGAGSGAVLAGIGFLLIAAPGRNARRGARRAA
jgi:hypothetical protein